MSNSINNNDQSVTISEQSIQNKSNTNLSFSFANYSDKNNLYKNIYGESSWEKSETSFGYKITCKNCNQFPSISFNDDYTMDLECICCLQKNIGAEYFLKNYIVKQDNNNDTILNLLAKKNYICITHSEKYFYYCVDCYRNLCTQCIGKSRSHYYDLKIILNGKEIKEIIANILSFIYEQKDIYNNEFSYLIKIIKLVLISHKIYPNYNSYLSINNFHKFIQDKFKKNENKINSNGKDNSTHNKPIKLLKIKQPAQLTNGKDLIYSINFNMKNFNDLKILEDLGKDRIESLKILYLSDCNITNITPLLNINIPNLEYLDLSMNYINDDYIHIFENTKFHNLKLLNLFGNYITSANLFKCFKGYKQLEELHLGKNSLDESIRKINGTNIKYEITTKEIGLTRGIFSNESINLISHFNFHNLEILYLSGNNISSLEFVEHLQNIDLKEIWLSSNLITEYIPLIQLKNLKKVLLNNNPISNITDLEQFTEELQYLEMIDFRDTKIDINNKDNAIIIGEIRKQIILKFE